MKKLLILIFVSLLLATSNPINLSAIDNVCSIDGLVNCSSLAEAITAVDSETDRVDRTVTIYMNSDHDLCSPETLTIPENCTIEIDLNGKTISNTLLDSNTPMITNNGVLTIIDKTGTGQIIINNTNHSNTIIQNNNIFDLDNGHLINNSEKTNSSAIINGADGLNRNSETYINGGFVSAPNGISIEQHGYSSTYNSLIKVNGGTFTAGLNTIKTTENINSYSTPLLIEGGEFNKNFDVDSTHCVRNATFANEIDAVLIADQFHQETISPDNHRITTQYDVKIGSTY